MFLPAGLANAPDARTQLYTGLVDATAVLEVASTDAGVDVIADQLAGPDGWVVGDVRVPADRLEAFAACIPSRHPRLWPVYVTAAPSRASLGLAAVWDALRAIGRADRCEGLMVTGVGLPLPRGPGWRAELRRLQELVSTVTRRHAPLYVRWCPSRVADRHDTVATLVDAARTVGSRTGVDLRCDLLVPADTLADPVPLLSVVAALADAGIGMRLTLHACRMPDDVLFEHTLSTFFGAMLVAEGALAEDALAKLLEPWPRVEFAGSLASLSGYTLSAPEIRLLRRQLVACGRVAAPMPVEHAAA